MIYLASLGSDLPVAHSLPMQLDGQSTGLIRPVRALRLPGAGKKKGTGVDSDSNSPKSAKETIVVRRSVQRVRPFGAASWTAAIADRLGLWSTNRPQGRPKRRTL